MATQDQDTKKRGGMIWIILLVVSLVVNIYQWVNRTTIVTTMEQQAQTLTSSGDSIKNLLTTTREELEHFRGKNSQLDSLLNIADSSLTAKEAKLKTALGQKKSLQKQSEELKAQLKDLQSFRDEYLKKVDSLLTANKELVAEKEKLTGRVDTLAKEKATMFNKASVLQAEYIKVTTFKRSSSGKYKEMTSAKRIHKMQVCFDILENSIAKPGDKNVYLKITEPGGKQLGDRSKGSGDMPVAGSGEMMLYASMTTINYANAKQNVCLNWEEEQEKMFPPGKYIIEVYVDGIIAGAGSYTLN